jgi:hypothetical protein
MAKPKNSVQRAQGSGTESPNELRVTHEEMKRLFATCVDLLTICARISGRLDPAIGAMVAYARDELLEAAVNDRKI